MLVTRTQHRWPSSSQKGLRQCTKQKTARALTEPKYASTIAKEPEFGAQWDRLIIHAQARLLFRAGYTWAAAVA